jgi:hypothetical protein
MTNKRQQLAAALASIKKEIATARKIPWAKTSPVVRGFCEGFRPDAPPPPAKHGHHF